MGKSNNTGTAVTGIGSLGELIGSLLSDNGKEIRFEIVCKVVDKQAEDKPPTESSKQNAIVFDEQNVPRPLSPVGRIDGIAALAGFLKCAPSTVQRMKNDGELPYYQRGLRIYFYEDEVLASMAQKPRRNSKQDCSPIVCEQTKFGTKYTPCDQ